MLKKLLPIRKKKILDPVKEAEKNAKRQRAAKKFGERLLYSATGLFAFMASWMIIRVDPNFQKLPPVVGYAVCFGVAILIVVVEIVRKRLKEKRSAQQGS